MKTNKIPLLFPLLKKGDEPRSCTGVVRSTSSFESASFTRSHERVEELFEASPPWRRRWPKAGGCKEEKNQVICYFPAFCLLCCG